MIYGECATIKENILYTFHVCRCSRALDVNFQLNVSRLLVRFVDSQKSSLFFLIEVGMHIDPKRREIVHQVDRERRVVGGLKMSHSLTVALQQRFLQFIEEIYGRMRKKIE